MLFVLFIMENYFLQCTDPVGWMTRKASSRYNLTSAIHRSSG